MNYKISESLINKILQYLSSKSYVEVFALIQEIQSNVVLLPEEKDTQVDSQ